MTRLSELGKQKQSAPGPAPADDDGLDLGTVATAPGALPPRTSPLSEMRARQSSAPAIESSQSVEQVERIEVDAVVGGCLMKITVTGVAPQEVLPWLKSVDPACKVRDDFPAKGTFGKRDTKRARLKAITLKASANGTFIDLVCKAEKSVSVTVSKKGADGFIAALAGTGKVYQENIEELQAAFEAKGNATVMLEAEEAVDVEYWTSEDGKSFMEALHPASAE